QILNKKNKVKIQQKLKKTADNLQTIVQKKSFQKKIKDFGDAPTNLILSLISHKKNNNKKSPTRHSQKLAAAVSAVLTTMFGAATHASLVQFAKHFPPGLKVKNLLLLGLYGGATFLIGLETLIVGASCSSHIRKSIDK
ncbi:hypothetical protein KAH94_06615, partial [bacterium]|nr:hypothetical protein [bacterium]